MINKTLIKQSYKINRKILFSISILISFFLIIMGIAFKIAFTNRNQESNRPSTGGGYIEAIDPSVIDDAKHRQASLLIYMICNMFPMLFSILSMVYVIITANSLIAAQVDKGSMAYTLSTPISRKELSFSQTIYLILSIIFINIVMILSAIVALLIVGNASWKQFNQILIIGLGSFLFNAALGSILFMFSCTFNTSSKSLAFGAGFAILCYVFFMLGFVSEQGSIESLEWLKIFQYLSLNSLFIPMQVRELKIDIVYQYLSLFIISIICFLVANIIFIKKDLPL